MSPPHTVTFLRHTLRKRTHTHATQQAGDEVVCGQCRPLSKTVRFNVLKVNPKGKQRMETRFKKFNKF